MLYKFVRDANYELNVAVFKPLTEINHQQSGIADVQSVILESVHTYDGKNLGPSYATNVFSIINVPVQETFEIGKVTTTTQTEPGRGIHCFTSTDSPYFNQYYEHFLHQLNNMRRARM